MEGAERIPDPVAVTAGLAGEGRSRRRRRSVVRRCHGRGPFKPELIYLCLCILKKSSVLSSGVVTVSNRWVMSVWMEWSIGFERHANIRIVAAFGCTVLQPLVSYVSLAVS